MTNPTGPSSGPAGRGEVDLTNCDREPIHIPGGVQPHGVLLVLEEPSLTIRQASDNAGEILGVPVDRLLGRGLGAFVDPARLAPLEAALRADDLRAGNPLRVDVLPGGGSDAPTTRFDGIAHRHDGLLILELEAAEPGRGDEASRESERLVRFAVSQLQGDLRLLDFCGAAAREVRALIGFDRVMVYRFDEEWNGEVIAEACDPALEPFHGLRYPASDIPAQARRLYATNWVRAIADITYRVSPIVPATSPETGRPVDLSHAALRSVSPIHVEYLRNMGVSASLSISILRGGKLWGLIACHHYSPRHLPFHLRASCEFLGILMSLQLSTKVDSEEAACRARASADYAALLTRVAGAETYVEGLVQDPEPLLDLVRATGAAIVHEGGIARLGEVPDEPRVAALATRVLEAGPVEGVFRTDSIAARFPELEGGEDVASGLLAIALPQGNRHDVLLWFRPEAIQTVSWGGNPEKHYEVGPNGPRLSPRGSFALWKETQRHRSVPWGECEVEAARTLRGGLIVATLRKIGELKEADRRKDEFLAMLAHELRNPLAAINNAIALARRSDRPEHAAWATGIVEQQVRHFTRMIDDLLDVSRVAQGKVNLRAERVELGEAIDRAVEIARPLIEERGHDLLVRVDGGPIEVMGDPTRLQQVILNLLTNAAKYTEEGGHIEVLADRDGDRASIRIRDDGVGIAADMLPKIFDLYTQADRSASLARGGLGIGLTLVRRLVELQGGVVTAASAGLGLGSEFTVTFPVAAAVEATSERIPPSPEPEARGARVLIVDDSVDSSNTLATILTLVGHDAEAVHDGTAALASVRSRRPDVVLLDINLPGMSGYEVARHLRGREGLADALIVAISGYGEDEDRARSIEAGMDLHLVKPLDIDELVAMLGQPGPAGTSALGARA